MPIDRVQEGFSSAIPPESSRPVDPSSKGNGERHQDGLQKKAKKSANPYANSTARRTSRYEKPVYVREVMHSRITTVSPESTVRKVAQIIVEEGVHDIAVIDDNKRLIGMVTDTNVLAVLLDGDKAVESKVREIMDAKALTATPDTTLREVSRVLDAEGLTSIPVVDDQITLVGLLTAIDLVRTLDHSKLNVWI